MPSALQIECFLRGARASTPIAVLGGTTIGVIAAALELGADVHVFDFAERVLEGVESRFGAANVTLHLQDLTHPVPSALAARFSIVVADAP
ncbi:hypothetical protein [Mesorhizobium sp.]|uniref:hypothetical protein n=1 Tax=Mesorhizobium sp. TaxID=1871066 RepID=UPI000FE97E2B|nr:hypothetical protein [Mesorhizobium sp.]RWC53218.1 MAG: hypothetical protein EOS56_30945 [Mesorhizobium sp.]RWC54007.1 MAG: hypothetical protein EOS29_29015 [Mesorhizobium sp.]